MSSSFEAIVVTDFFCENGFSIEPAIDLSYKTFRSFEIGRKYKMTSAILPPSSFTHGEKVG